MNCLMVPSKPFRWRNTISVFMCMRSWSNCEGPCNLCPCTHKSTLKYPHKPERSERVNSAIIRQFRLTATSFRHLSSSVGTFLAFRGAFYGPSRWDSVGNFRCTEFPSLPIQSFLHNEQLKTRGPEKDSSDSLNVVVHVFS